MKYRSIFLATFLLVLSVYAQENQYRMGTEFRVQGDLEAAEDRRLLNEILTDIVAEWKQDYPNISLEVKWDFRLIAQYSRGGASAFAVIPGELTRVLETISTATNKNVFHENYVCSTTLAGNNIDGNSDVPTHDEIELAYTSILKTKKVFLTYCGYGFPSDCFPDYDFDEHKLTYFLKWNEMDRGPASAELGYYDNYDISTAEQIIRGIILSHREAVGPSLLRQVVQESMNQFPPMPSPPRY